MTNDRDGICEHNSQLSVNFHAPNSRVHVQVLHVVRGLSVVDLSYDRKDGVHVRHDCWRHVEIMWPFSAFSFTTS